MIKFVSNTPSGHPVANKNEEEPQNFGQYFDFIGRQTTHQSSLGRSNEMWVLHVLLPAIIVGMKTRSRKERRAIVIAAFFARGVARRRSMD